jgi:hypothetical protein
MKTAALGLGLALALMATGATAQPQPAPALNTLTAQEKAAGWKLLFDGRTTKGWREFKRQDIQPGWKVVDGALTLVDPRNADDIITTKKYADFDLTFEWRIAKLGNSGVYYHVIEQGDHGYESGPEYQLLDNAHGEAPEQQAASLFALYAPSMDMTLPIGQFNHARIVVYHGHVQHWLNGMKVVEYDLGSPEFKAKVAASKFHQWPIYASSPTGYISLQDHEAVVAFRNIKIKPLD